MQHLNSYADSRFMMSCAFCGGKTETRDHCPSRVFLDEPYPENLPIVPACGACNNGFSLDEEYVACLISCTIAGSTDPALLRREKTSRILRGKSALRSRLEASWNMVGAGIEFQPESERVTSVITKLAQGHALHELGESCHEPLTELVIRPLLHFSSDERSWFEHPEAATVWPEIGSRAMQRLALGGGVSPWIEVQEERYRFHAQAGRGIELRIVLHEYLAAYCRWEN